MKDLVLQNCRLDGRYDIRERLGRGSYAEIFSAEDTVASSQSSHKTVVIKALNVFLQNDLDHDLEKTLVENFQNEAIALDRVRHPNILSRLGHGTAKDLRGTVFHYLVLEYLPGGDLARYCRHNSLGVKQALDYLEQVCAGLSNAHKNDIIPRDIKPQNLLLTADCKIVKIADFGVARAGNSEAPITRVGTNIYAPPEHSPLLAGQTGALNHSILTPAADIYSLAKTAYVLFTGESPRFSSNQPIDELPHAMRQLPWAAKLVEVLQKATLENPRDRYQDVLDFWADLSQVSVIETGTVPVGERFTLTNRSTRSNPVPQAHVALGFTPNVPIKPKFNTTKNLRLQPVAPTTPLNAAALKYPPAYKKQFLPADFPSAEAPLASHPEPVPAPVPRKRKKRALRVLATLAILLIVFAGSLFATYNYLLGRPLLAGWSHVSTRVGIATTDINLRPAPTTSNTPVGVVTKNSKVEIIRTSNNWHEVVIIQHGRPKGNPSFVEKGWVYGSYVLEE